MRFLRALVISLVNRGVSSQNSASRKSAVRASNVVFMAGIPAYLVFDVLYIIMKDYWLLAVNLFFVLATAIIWYFAGDPKRNAAARIAFHILSNLAIFSISYVTGRSSGAEFFYLMLICVTFVMFDKEQEDRLTWPFLVYTFVLFILGQFIVPDPKLNLPSIAAVGLDNYRRASFIITGMMIFFITRYLRTIYTLAQEELESETRKVIHNDRMLALGQMASSVAHEINNPLSVIRGLSEESLEALKGEKVDRSEIQEYLTRVVSMAERINKIVRALGLYSRKNEADPFRPASVAKIVSDATILFEEQLASQRVQFTVNVANPDLRIFCREVQVLQVLVNLLQNAKDAVKDDRSPWIRLEVEALAEEHVVQFSVTDSGYTLNIPNRNRVFEPFFTSKEIGKGTGLGLSISQGIVLDHGGEIYLDEKSEHTKFVFTIKSAN